MITAITHARWRSDEYCPGDKCDQFALLRAIECRDGARPCRAFASGDREGVSAAKIQSISIDAKICCIAACILMKFIG